MHQNGVRVWSASLIACNFSNSPRVYIELKFVSLFWRMVTSPFPSLAAVPCLKRAISWNLGYFYWHLCISLGDLLRPKGKQQLGSQQMNFAVLIFFNSLLTPTYLGMYQKIMGDLRLSPEIKGPHSLAGCNGNSHVEAQETEDFFPWIRKHNGSSGQGSSWGPELQLTCPVTLARDCDFYTSDWLKWLPRWSFCGGKARVKIVRQLTWSFGFQKARGFLKSPQSSCWTELGVW